MDLLDTNDHDEDLRIEVFREALLSSSVPSLVTLEDDARRVQTRMSRWEFGPLMLFTSRSTGWRVARDARFLRMEGPPMVSLSLQTAGTGRFGRLGRQSLVRPGELMLNDLTFPYEFSCSGTGTAYAPQLPYDALGLPPEIVRRGAERLTATPMYDMVRAHLLRLHADADALSADPGAEALGSGTIALLRALITSAAGVDAHSRPALAESLLHRVLAYTRARLRDPGLSADRTASAHGISVRALYGLFAKAGLSMEQWIIEQRLEGACAALVSPATRTRTIEHIAYSWGFSTPSHFTRRFKAAYGVTPRQWRAARPLVAEGMPLSSSAKDGGVSGGSVRSAERSGWPEGVPGLVFAGPKRECEGARILFHRRVGRRTGTRPWASGASRRGGVVCPDRTVSIFWAGDGRRDFSSRPWTRCSRRGRDPRSSCGARRA
ncbi:helix-turn-helix domain-containing protein [Streptomyces sp. NPDC088757]|uniref:helix-turn-helix domain-containing protein n=1 Tax=Streptomyces sp. NPDC088757 TaxID=3365889 RepID=UPI003812879A